MLTKADGREEGARLCPSQNRQRRVVQILTAAPHHHHHHQHRRTPLPTSPLPLQTLSKKKNIYIYNWGREEKGEEEEEEDDKKEELLLLTTAARCSSSSSSTKWCNCAPNRHSESNLDRVYISQETRTRQVDVQRRAVKGDLAIDSALVALHHRCVSNALGVDRPSPPRCRRRRSTRPTSVSRLGTTTLPLVVFNVNTPTQKYFTATTD